MTRGRTGTHALVGDSYQIPHDAKRALKLRSDHTWWLPSSMSLLWSTGAKEEEQQEEDDGEEEEEGGADPSDSGGEDASERDSSASSDSGSSGSSDTSDSSSSSSDESDENESGGGSGGGAGGLDEDGGGGQLPAPRPGKVNQASCKLSAGEQSALRARLHLQHAAAMVMPTAPPPQPPTAPAPAVDKPCFPFGTSSEPGWL